MSTSVGADVGGTAIPPARPASGDGSCGTYLQTIGTVDLAHRAG